jgi:hypothetical protein
MASHRNPASSILLKVMLSTALKYITFVVSYLISSAQRNEKKLQFLRYLISWCNNIKKIKQLFAARGGTTVAVAPYILDV